jgi:hypothetical protein
MFLKNRFKKVAGWSVYLLDVGPRLDITPEEADGLLGLGERLDLVAHDERHLGDVVDPVAWLKKRNTC